MVIVYISALGLDWFLVSRLSHEINRLNHSLCSSLRSDSNIVSTQKTKANKAKLAINGKIIPKIIMKQSQTDNKT